MNKNNLKELKDNDIYSLSMFALYKLSEIPEYAAISELPYILDKDNMLKFCQYFGGSTIRVPTIDELHSLMYLLLLHQYINIEGIPYEEAIKLINYEPNQLSNVKAAYLKLCKVLDNYDIKTKTNY